MGRTLSSGPVGWLLLLLLAALTTFALGKPVYFVVGDSLTLTPSPTSSPIKSIEWTHNNNLVAEWLGEVTEYFGPFKGRTILYPNSGILNITRTTSGDVGQFKIEINSLAPGEEFTATAIKKVTKPKLELRTLSCNKHSASCNYSCIGETAGVKPVTYSWRIDQRQWEPEQESADFELFSTKVSDGRMIECRMKNPVSQESSNPVDNPLYQEPGGHGGLIGGLIALGVALCAAGGLSFSKRDFIKSKISECMEKDSKAEEGEAAAPMNA